MSLIKKLLPVVIAYNILTTGCAGVYSLNNLDQKEEAKLEKIAKMLNTSPMNIEYLPNGYITTKDLAMDLRLIAGLYAGTVKLEKTKNGWVAVGDYSYILNPEAMKKALKKADKNKDKIITREEVRSLENEVLGEYMK